MSTIATSLRREIRRQGLSNEEFARRWGISNGTLYSLLAGRPVGSLATARKLTAAGIHVPRNFLDSAA